jgi:hypothetical protein
MAIWAWFILDTVEAVDRTAFYGAYRADGHAAPPMSRR